MRRIAELQREELDAEGQRAAASLGLFGSGCTAPNSRAGQHSSVSFFVTTQVFHRVSAS